jgi:predicted enzyme related to lactoylglutathione lyase
MILVARGVQIFDQAIEHLNSRDVTLIFGPMSTPFCRMAFIADPDGNRI